MMQQVLDRKPFSDDPTITRILILFCTLLLAALILTHRNPMPAPLPSCEEDEVLDYINFPAEDGDDLYCRHIDTF